MNPGSRGFKWGHRSGENATRPIARLAGRLAALLVVAGAAPASSSRLASRPASRTPVSYTHLDVYKRQLLDLDIGMNDSLCQPFDWDDQRRYDRCLLYTSRCV